MRAAVYHGPRDIRIESVDDPTIQEPGDVILKTRTASMCGSDLYLFNGEVEDMVAPGRTTLGHEICGQVVEVGPDCSRFKVGDRVTFPYSVSCGDCFACRIGQTAHCETSGKAIYGFGVAFGDLGGSQAEYVRVPLADGHLFRVPDDISDEAAIFLSCNLPAALTAVEAAEIGPTASVAIIGAGPTGLLALELARKRTHATVLALDSVASRLAYAERLGATAVDISGDVLAAVAAATEGRGVDRVIEFAGRGPAFALAVSIARPGGVISGGGVYLEQEFPVSLFDMFFKNLQIRLNGFSNTAVAQWQASRLLQSGVIDPTALLTHQTDLDGLPDAATWFAERKDGFLKMLVRVDG